jgi:hypothetical protein
MYFAIVNGIWRNDGPFVGRELAQTAWGRLRCSIGEFSDLRAGR